MWTGPDLFEIEKAHAVNALGRDEIETDPLPAAPLLFLENEFVALDDDLGRRVLGVDEHFERDSRLRSVRPERVRRPRQLGLDPVPDDRDVVDPAASAGFLDDGRRSAGVKVEDAIGPLEVGGVHAGQRSLPGRDGRIVRRHLEDRGRDAGILEDLPEGPDFTEVADLTGREGNDGLADPDGLRGTRGFRRGEDGEISSGITVDEIEDGVTARVHAGDEVRPGHGRLRRQACPERPKVAALGEEPGEGREPAFVHPPPRQDGIQSVEAEDDHLLRGPGPAVDLGDDPGRAAEPQGGRGNDARLDEIAAAQGRPRPFFAHGAFLLFLSGPAFASTVPAASTRARPSI